MFFTVNPLRFLQLYYIQSYPISYTSDCHPIRIMKCGENLTVCLLTITTEYCIHVAVAMVNSIC